LTNYEKLRDKKQKKYIEELKKQLSESNRKLAIANGTVFDLMNLSDMQERHKRTAEKALEREWIIREYLEEQNRKLILALAE
jgi:tRNA-dihydrouridine synthase